MNNAVLYLRYSSHSQNEQTIETQRDICEKYAKANKLKIIGEYVDKAKSGRNDDRENFQKMIEDSNKKVFQFVIIYKTDRFARDRYDSAINKRKLKKSDVRVLSATEPITADKEGILLEAMLEGLAEYYSANLSENIKNGLATNAKKGLSIGGLSLPLGFKSNPDTREILVDNETAFAVKKIFTMYKDKSTMADITRYLNLQGIKTSRGNEFGKSSIRRILENKKYIGTYTFRGIETPNLIPRIIDDKLFNEVQNVLKDREGAPGRARTKTDYILSGKLVCGYCEGLMTGNPAKKIYHYYKCVNSKGSNKTCHKKFVEKDLIEDFVVNKAREMLTSENINIIAKKLSDYIDKTQDDSEIKKLNKLIKKNRQEYENYLNSVGSCPSDKIKQDIFSKMENLDNSLNDLNISLALKEANSIKITAPKIKIFLNELKKGNVNDLRYRKMLIEMFVYKVFLYDDDEIMIVFTLNDNSFKGKVPSKSELISSFQGQTAPPD